MTPTSSISRRVCYRERKNTKDNLTFGCLEEKDSTEGTFLFNVKWSTVSPPNPGSFIQWLPLTIFFVTFAFTCRQCFCVCFWAKWHRLPWHRCIWTVNAIVLVNTIFRPPIPANLQFKFYHRFLYYISFLFVCVRYAWTWTWTWSFVKTIAKSIHTIV